MINKNRIPDAIADLRVLADEAKSPATRAGHLETIKFLTTYLKDK